MTIDVLRYCVDLVYTKSITKTAEKFHISQQALSQQIKNLEYELDVRLFERNSRGLEITPAGRVILAEIHPFIDRLGQAVCSAKNYDEGLVGTLNIGYNGPSSRRYLTMSLTQLNKNYPAISVTLQEGGNSEIVSRFLRGDYDVIALGDFYDFDSKNYSSIAFNSGPICAVLGREHPLADKRVINPEELLDETYISIDLRGFPEMLERSMKRCASILGQRPKNVRFADKTNSVDILVSAGYGYTFLSRDLQDYYNEPALRFIPLEGIESVHNHRFVWSRHNMNPALNIFVKTCESLQK